MRLLVLIGFIIPVTTCLSQPHSAKLMAAIQASCKSKI
jgi:hypothetical protein